VDETQRVAAFYNCDSPRSASSPESDGGDLNITLHSEDTGFNLSETSTSDSTASQVPQTAQFAYVERQERSSTRATERNHYNFSPSLPYQSPGRDFQSPELYQSHHDSTGRTAPYDTNQIPNLNFAVTLSDGESVPSTLSYSQPDRGSLSSWAQPSQFWPELNAEKACLLRYFVDNLAKWVGRHPQHG
jgi:hypothetical protein